MKRAPVGAEVGLYLDVAAVDVGDVVLTPTGRTYIVMRARQQARGKHAGRWHLRVTVAEPLENIVVPVGSRIIAINWYKRARRLRDRGRSR